MLRYCSSEAIHLAATIAHNASLFAALFQWDWLVKIAEQWLHKWNIDSEISPTTIYHAWPRAYRNPRVLKVSSLLLPRSLLSLQYSFKNNLKLKAGTSNRYTHTLAQFTTVARRITVTQTSLAHFLNQLIDVKLKKYGHLF